MYVNNITLVEKPETTLKIRARMPKIVQSRQKCFNFLIMRFYNLGLRKVQFGKFSSVVFVASILLVFKLPAQVSCGGEVIGTVCLRYPSQPYACIDGNFDSPSLYGTKLLDPVQAQSTPQRLIVKGKGGHSKLSLRQPERMIL